MLVEALERWVPAGAASEGYECRLLPSTRRRQARCPPLPGAFRFARYWLRQRRKIKEALIFRQRLPTKYTKNAKVLRPKHRHVFIPVNVRVFSGPKILRFKILILRLQRSHDTNFNRLRAKATARQASPHELTHTN